MKNGKLLFLLIAILSFAVLFCSCDLIPTGDTSEPKNETTAVENTPIAEPEEIEHEIRDHFVIENDIENLSFANISKLEGEILQLDRENNLVSLVTKDLDNYNNVKETVKVYDITVGEYIFEDSVTYPLFATGNDAVALNVTIDYPIIRVSKESYSEDSTPIYNVSYYFAKKDSTAIRTTSNSNYSRTDFYNGLVAFDMGDDVVWINRNMEEVRSVNAIAANGYDIEVFNAEYQDYLYAWSESEVQVFNRAGICSAKYTIEHAGALNVHVLNNGNVLIQDLEVVDEYTPCDFTWSYSYYNSPLPSTQVNRIKLTSYVMDCRNGAIEEVELDFIVDELETAYEGRCGNNYFPFALAGNGQNQAFIYRFANGSLSLYKEYVSLGNDLEIKYSVKNDKIGADFSTATVINANLYEMTVVEGGVRQNYVFDLDGNVVTAKTGNALVTDTYVVTENAIYDHNMNVVYDFSATEFAGKLAYADASTNTVYLYKYNFSTGGIEIYTFDHATKAPKLLLNGTSDSLFYFGAGYYLSYNEENNDHSVISITDGKVILKTLEITDIRECDNALIVETEFEGNTLVYVIK